MTSGQKDRITLKWYEVERSIVQYGIRRGRSKLWDELAELVRASVRRHDWNEEWRRGYGMPWEIALADVLAFEALFRRCSERLPDGRTKHEQYRPEPPAPGRVVVGPACPVQVAAYVEPEPERQKPVELLSNEDVTKPGGYRGNAGWTNGGIAGFRATRNDKAEQHIIERAVFGVAAFSEVIGCGGLPELAWYHSASEFEVGMSTNLDVQVLARCGASTSGGTAPGGPNAHQVDAATTQREIRTALREISPRHQAVIETAYEDRCLPTSQVNKYGHGIAAIVARANAAKRAFVDSPQGDAVKSLSEALQTLAGVRKRAATDWEPLTKHGATELLREAHACYLVARGQKGSPPSRKRKPRKKRHEPAMLVTGKAGATKRRFYEAA